MQVSIHEAIQGPRKSAFLRLSTMGRMRLTSLNVYGPIAKQRELVRAASNWCDNTASQNMFLNIFFLHPTMHGGPLLNSWDFMLSMPSGLAIAGFTAGGY